MKSKKKVNKKEVTIENLARMTGQGFSEVKGELSEIKEEITDMKEEITDMKDRQDGMDRKLDALMMEFMDMKKKLDNIVYRHEFEYLKDRMTELEKKLSATLKKH